MTSASEPELIPLAKTNWMIYRYPILASTNIFLKQEENQFPDYSVIWAEKQTQGRGRFSREWISEAGEDLTFSLLLPLKEYPFAIRPNLTQAAAFAIVQLLEKYQLSPFIRWPNDVLIQRRKISGILCELLGNQEDSRAVLGIGLNVNSGGSWLETIDQPATSLYSELKKKHSVQEILEQLLYSLFHCLELLKEDGFLQIRDKIKKRLTFINEQIIVTDGARQYSGRFLDLNCDGTLLFQTEAGKVLTIHSGEISIQK